MACRTRAVSVLFGVFFLPKHGEGATEGPAGDDVLFVSGRRTVQARLAKQRASGERIQMRTCVTCGVRLFYPLPLRESGEGVLDVDIGARPRIDVASAGAIRVLQYLGM